MKYELHPACAAWPEMPAHELIALADDITLNGLRMPLTLTPDGLLLDGRNRALACEQAGVEPTTLVHDGDPVLFSLSQNLHRRHLSVQERAEIAAKMANMVVGKPNPNSAKLHDNISLEKAAKLLGVSRRSVATAKAKLKIPKINKPEAIAKAMKAATGKMPTSGELSKVAGIHERSASTVLRVVKHVEEAQGAPPELRFTKAQDLQVEARIKAETEQLRASFNTAVDLKVNEILAQRDKQDTETIEQANALLASRSGRQRPPFTAEEYTSVLLRALHPDTSTSENRLEAFKLVNNKKLLLRDEGRIQLRGQRLPKTVEEWEAAKAAATASRKKKKG